jgi:subtilase family serine protease
MLLAGLVGSASAGPSVYSARTTAIDLGRNSQADAPITLTVALKLSHTDELESLLASTYSPGSPNYRHFLTPGEFAARFGPTRDSIDRVTRHLRAAGFRVEQTSPSHLSVTGSMSTAEQEFGVAIHTYEIPASQGAPAFRFRGPAGAARMSGAIANDVEAVIGLDNRPRYRPLNHRLMRAPRLEAARSQSASPNTPDPPGEWTVLDLAQYYDVVPLYNQGITGRKRTIGIVTLASFTPSDAFAYWASLGLSVDKHRIKIVDIDGGPGDPSDDSGSGETTLDVQQSGGLAPGAQIIVYQAPNTDQAFVDAFARAVGDNKADSVSVSWGEWEGFLVQGTPVSDPNAAGDLRAIHNLFIQAALQGQSLSAASGDSGSYDTSGTGLNNVLSADHPAADPYILAAGGTTLAGEQDFLLPDGSIYSLTVPSERAWSWDYLNGLCAALGFDPVSCGIFPVGGGGGVSVVFPTPFYQLGVNGVQASAPGQVVFDITQSPPQKLLRLPANFPGRNLPDVSLNADPETGYLLFYTSSSTGFDIQPFWGGTSFVAPQIAGITALLDESTGGRIGLLNFALYQAARKGNAYSGHHAPLRDIRAGNNEFYKAAPGYDLASGLGVLDVANLNDLLR